MKSIRIWGIDVYLHWTMLLMLMMFVMHHGPAGILVCAVLYGSVLLHEFGHAAATNLMGYRCKKIVLLILGGVAFQEMRMKTKHRLIAYVAGPVVSFLLTIIGVGTTLALVHFNALPPTHSIANLVLGYFVWINMILLIFNLLPIYPMDGGGIMHCINLIRKSNEIEACKITAQVSIIGCVGLCAYGIYQMHLFLIFFSVLFFFMNKSLYLNGEQGSASKDAW
jgi:Zn-dependent protease